MQKKKIILSIETGVRGGSLSLRRGAAEIDCWIGTGQVSKSEDVLVELKKILKRNDLKKNDVDKICVSRGPGSHTGIRIGIALAHGLGKALGCELRGVALLEAMRLKVCGKSVDFGREVIAAVPFGKTRICWQNFKLGEPEAARIENQPRFSTVEEFLSFCGGEILRPTKNIILHSEIYSLLQRKFGNQTTGVASLIDAGDNLAAIIGETEAESSGATDLQPIYAGGDGFSTA